MSKKEKIVYTVLGIFLVLLLIFNTLWLWLVVDLIFVEHQFFQDPYDDYITLSLQRGTENYILMDDTVYLRTDRVYLDPAKVERGEIRLYSVDEVYQAHMEKLREYGALNSDPAEE